MKDDLSPCTDVSGHKKLVVARASFVREIPGGAHVQFAVEQLTSSDGRGSVVGMPASKRPSPAVQSKPDGFTLVELVVVVGILMILAGLLAPSLSAARLQARRTRVLAQMSQAGKLIDLYAQQSKDLYPVADPKVFLAAKRWYEPLIVTGLYDSIGAVDDLGVETRGEPSIAMSMAMAYDPAKMRPGSTVPIADALARAISRSQVAAPSSKGLGWQWWLTIEPSSGYWCCAANSPPGATVFADGSAAMHRWSDFTTIAPPEPSSNMGYPIMSTWNGVLGMDKYSATP